jgi:hypothetical protein
LFISDHPIPDFTLGDRMTDAINQFSLDEENDDFINEQIVDRLQDTDIVDASIMYSLVSVATEMPPTRTSLSREAKTKGLRVRSMQTITDFLNDSRKQNTQLKKLMRIWTFRYDLDSDFKWETDTPFLCRINDFEVPMGSSVHLYAAYDYYIVDAFMKIIEIRSNSCLTGAYFMFLECMHSQQIMDGDLESIVRYVSEHMSSSKEIQGIFSPLNCNDGRYMLVFIDCFNLQINIFDCLDASNLYQDVFDHFAVFVYRLFYVDYCNDEWKCRAIIPPTTPNLPAKDGDVFVCVVTDLLWQKVAYEEIISYITEASTDATRALMNDFLRNLHYRYIKKMFIKKCLYIM